MPNEKNKQIVKNLKEKLQKAKSITFADYTGLSAGDANDLRSKIKESNGETLVAKNTLMKVAIEESENKELQEAKNDLEGQIMTVFSYEDAIAPIKALFDFLEDKDFLNIKGAVIEGVYNTKEKVQQIKDIPSKEELLSKLVGSLNSPISGLVSVTSGVQRKFVQVLHSLSEKKEA